MSRMSRMSIISVISAEIVNPCHENGIIMLNPLKDEFIIAVQS
jgi:hypothetical protein